MMELGRVFNHILPPFLPHFPRHKMAWGCKNLGWFLSYWPAPSFVHFLPHLRSVACVVMSQRNGHEEVPPGQENSVAELNFISGCSPRLVLSQSFSGTVLAAVCRLLAWVGKWEGESDLSWANRSVLSWKVGDYFNLEAKLDRGGKTMFVFF